MRIFELPKIIFLLLFQNKKILITGGLGFIGSNLARRLVKLGAEVTIVDGMIPLTGANEYNIRDIRDSVEVVIGKVLHHGLIGSLIKDKDILFNLAGMTSHMDSMTDPDPDLENNVSAHLYLLDACLKANPGIRIIYTGTRQIYGKPGYLPVDELHPVVPVDLNGVHKAAGERYHQIYHDYHGLRTTIFRLTNTYGPGMRIKDSRQTFLGIWFRKMVEGEKFEVFGDGAQKRDFNHVEDVIDAFLLAVENENSVGRTYNLGAPEACSLLEVARMLSQIEGREVFDLIPFPEHRSKIDIGDYFSDIGRIRSELGWSPAVPLERGLRETLDYYRLTIQHYI